MPTPLKRPTLLITAACVLAGCYQSTGRNWSMQGDAETHQDALQEDPRADPDRFDVHEGETQADLDMEEEEIEPPSYLCEPAGSIQITGEQSQHNASQLFWNGSEVGVVLMDGGGDWVHIFVGLVNVAPDLSSHGEEVLIGEESHGWGEPAWTGEALGLCWHGDPGMVGRTAFRLLDRDGGQIGPRVDIDFDGEACLDLAYGAGRFLAAWRHFTHLGEDGLVDTRIQMVVGQG
jgi:hypothetical protein